MIKKEKRVVSKIRIFAWFLTVCMISVQSLQYCVIPVYAQEIEIQQEEDSGGSSEEDLLVNEAEILEDELTDEEADTDNADTEETDLEETSTEDTVTEDADTEETDEAETGETETDVEETGTGDTVTEDTEVTDTEETTGIDGEDIPDSPNQLPEISEPNVDFSKDLKINIEEGLVDTVKPDGKYDEVEPGTYLPGIDGSAEDNVTVDSKVTYVVNISFESESKTDYDFNDVSIVMVDKNGKPIKGNKTPVYYTMDNGDFILDEDDPLLETGRTAKVASVKWPDGEKKNFHSSGTVSMSINFELEDATMWNTMLSPQFKVVCKKGQDSAVSQVFSLSEVFLSSKAGFQTSFYSAGASASVDNEQKLISVPFKISSSKTKLSGISRLADNPQFESMTYWVKVAASLDGIDLADTLSSDDFIAEITKPGDAGISTSVDYNPENHMLAVTLAYDEIQEGVASEYNLFDTMIYVNLPTEAIQSRVCEVNVNLSLDQQQGGMVCFNGESPAMEEYDPDSRFQNSNLFEITCKGSGGFKDKVEISQDGTEGGIPYISDTITSHPENGKIDHSVSFNGKDVLLYDGMKIFQFLESEVHLFQNDGILSVKIGNEPAEELDPGLYTVSYRSVPRLPGDEINKQDTVQIAGELAAAELDAYEEGGNYNIKCFTLNDEFVNYLTEKNVTDQNITIDILDSTFTLSEEMLNQIPLTDTAIRHRFRIVSMLSFPLADSDNKEWESEINAQGKAAKIVDKNLILGADRYSNALINRFNAASKPKDNLKVMDYYDTYVLKLLKQSDLSPVSQVEDYNQGYQLNIARTSKYTSAKSVLKEGSVLTLKMPEQVMPLLTQSGDPYVQLPEGSQVAISNYKFDYPSKTITVNMPCDVDMSNLKSGIFIPVIISMPSTSVIMDASQTGLTVTGGCTIMKPGDLMHGFSLNPLVFKINFEGAGVTFLFGNPDAQGLKVPNPQYEPGSAVGFVGKIFNTTNSTHDYYMGVTVPTAKYNMSNSNNQMEGYITSLEPDHNITAVYYLEKDKATSEDIAVMKGTYQNGNGVKSLAQWYEEIQRGGTNWVSYIPGDTLPDDVVMAIGFWNDFPTGNTAQLNYDVVMDLSQVGAGTYRNLSDMKYYSENSEMEVRSNQVVIVTTKEETSEDTEAPDVPNVPSVPEISNPVITPEPGTSGSSDSSSSGNGRTSSSAGDTNITVIDENVIPMSSGDALLSNKQKELEDALTFIDDGSVPLAGLPKTGQSQANTALWLMSMLMLLGAYVAGHKEKED